MKFGPVSNHAADRLVGNQTEAGMSQGINRKGVRCRVAASKIKTFHLAALRGISLL